MRGRMKGLTKRQHEILEYVQEFIQKHHYSPSYREVMHHFGFSSLGSVYKHIDLLKRKGKLGGENKAKRSLFIPDDQPTSSLNGSLELPLVGSISSDHQIELLAKPQSIVVPVFLVHMPEKTYVLRIRGDTLQEEFMADHDLLIVEARQEALSGEVIIAVINDEDLMIKRYYQEEGKVRLESYCKQHEPIFLSEDSFAIKGVVIGLIRQFL